MNFWWAWLLCWVVVGAGGRVLALMFYPDYGGEIGFFEFSAGIANDLQAFGLIAGLVAFGGLIGPRSLRAFAVFGLGLWLILLFAEGFFWFEFESRLDRLVFHYLAYPVEVLAFLDDQFYLTVILLPFIGAVWLLVRIFGLPEYGNLGRSPYGAAIVLMGSVVWFGAPVAQSDSRVASEFVSNGLLGVLTDARYDISDIAWLQGGADAFEQNDLPDNPSDLSKQVRAEVAGKSHLMLIIEESFAGPVWEQSELRDRYLPNYQRLARQSIEFTNVFATGSRTTRGMEALLNGFPPIPGISTTERDRSERLPSLARALAQGGFMPVFLYGGWPDFSGFSNYWKQMGFAHVWSRHDFSEPFETSWGVADGALFRRIIEEMGQLTQAHQRVFLSTLTLSHHRPYDFPDGVVAFPSDTRRSEFAMAYADQALGDFMRQAAEQPWYDDTLFVIVADHGLTPRGDALVPASSYRVPLLIHGSGLEPRVISTLGSTMSLAKTLTELFAVPDTEPFAGGDLLCGCDTVVPVEYGYRIGLLQRDGLLVVDEHGSFHRWHYDVGRNEIKAVDRTTAEGRDAVLGYFGPAQRWFYETSLNPRPMLAR